MGSKHSTADAETPLVTFALLSYNQETYVGDAARAALAQTYHPLQIILSDDCSADRSFEILHGIAHESPSSHEIMLNRNERNLGLVGHINRIAELARGQIVVLAASDDISLPTRVARLVAEFRRRSDVRAVFSGYTEINSAGEKIRDVTIPDAVRYYTSLDVMAKTCGWVGLGATFAYDRQCLVTPGPIPGEILCEDGLLPFRAALMGGVSFIAEPLLLYRRHDLSATSAARFDSPAYDALHHSVVMEELGWALRSNVISRNAYERAKRRLNRWPRYAARARRFRRNRTLTKLNHAFYHSDVWCRRLMSLLLPGRRARS